MVDEMNWNSSKSAFKKTDPRKWSNKLLPWSFPIDPYPSFQASAANRYAVATIYCESTDTVGGRSSLDTIPAENADSRKRLATPETSSLLTETFSTDQKSNNDVVPTSYIHIALLALRELIVRRCSSDTPSI